jgi:nucleoid-associated protein YgaU
MKLFQSKQRVHLSPRLARSIGKEKTYKSSSVSKAAAAVLAILIFASAHAVLNKHHRLESSALAQTQAEGKVLGAESHGVANYVVQDGDTLLSVSQKFAVYWMSIVEENEITPPYTLTPGQTLRIPLPGAN